MKKILLLLFLSVCFQVLIFAAKPKKHEISIYFTNDTNGHPLPFTYLNHENQGGIASRATLIKNLTSGISKNNYLILDAGGITLGRPESNLFQGFPDIYGMNSIGYFAAGVGISELQLSNKHFDTLNNNADFYFLCANVQNIEGNNICDSYITKKLGGFDGITVGIFSVINDEAKSELIGESKNEFVFLDPIKKATEMVEELKNKKNKCDIIIALTQLGYYEDDSTIGSRTLASSVNGIDIIIDGRTGKKLSQAVTINSTRIVQAYKWGLYLGEIKLSLTDKKITDFTYNLHPVNFTAFNEFEGEPLVEDKKTATAIKSKMKNYDSLINKPVAKIIEGSFDPKYIRYRETEIGNLICDAMLEYTGAHIAFQNSGGIGNVKIEPSELTRQSLDSIIKYDNSIVVVNLTGEEVMSALERSFSRMGYGAFLQVGGITVKYSKGEQKITEISVNDRPLKKSAFYKVAINSWLASGGDGYSMFAELPNKLNHNILHREIVYNYLENKSEYTPKLDGRITIVK